jgi:hypothetical protein
MQTGETLRGLLLTTFGFSVLGDMAGLASKILFGLGAVMVVLSVAGLVHALVVPQDELVLGLVRQPRAAVYAG